MNDYSLTQTGNLTAFAGLIVLILSHFHIALNQEEVATLLGAVVTLAGIITSWIGRYRKGDLTLGGMRKPKPPLYLESL